MEPLLGSGTVLKVLKDVGFTAELGEKTEPYDTAVDPIEPRVVWLVSGVDTGMKFVVGVVGERSARGVEDSV